MKKITNLFFVFIILISTFLLASCGEKKIIEFKTCVLNNDGSYELIVENDVESFSFLNEIVIDQNYSYFISKDDYGLDTYQTKIVPLSVGENKFYIFVLDNDGKTKEKLTINIIRQQYIHVFILTEECGEIVYDLKTTALPGGSCTFYFTLDCTKSYLVKMNVLLDNESSTNLFSKINTEYLTNEWINIENLNNDMNRITIFVNSSLSNNTNNISVKLQYKSNFDK